MFDPADYFQSVERVIDSCEKWVEIERPGHDSPKIVLDNFRRWKEIDWRFQGTFPNKTKILAFEGHYRGPKGKHLRNINYKLFDGRGKLIFRICTHGNSIPFADCPHLHTGPKGDERIEEGDPRLGANSLRNFDFLKFWSWVHEYLKDNGRLPWRQ